MKISILHLSDLHFKKENNSFLAKEEALFNALKNAIVSNQYLFIVITGDLVYSGKKEEFSVVKGLLNRLESKISSYNNKIKIEYIFCEGNHDCDFSGPQKLRNLSIDAVINNPETANNEDIDICTSIQEEYFNFVKEFPSYRKINHKVSNRLISRYEYILGKYKVVFNAFNSAWVSKLKEQQAEIVFPLQCIKQNEILDETQNLSFSLLHHPFHWLKHRNMREFKEYLDSMSDIILTGHEHTAKAVKIEDIYSENHIEHIEGGTLHDTYDEEESAFNLILIDLEDKKHDILIFNWDKNYYAKTEYVNLEVLASHKCLFQMKKKYKNKISSLGMTIKHPRKDKIILDDLFVFPDLKVIDAKKSKTNSFSEISSDKLVKGDELGLNVIYGGDNAGKTTLAHMLQIIYKQNGLLPIIINGKDFKSKDYTDKRIIPIVKRAFKQQYGDEKKKNDLFEQIDVSLIVLIIDDFHNAQLNSDYKSLLVNSLEKLNYKNILFFADDVLRFEATSESNLAIAFENFTHYKILEFGHKLRDRLITKWIKLGQESEIENSDLADKRREKANAINQTIGLNFVESHPVYLIMLLHAMEVNDNSLDKSAYGHYYHYMIMQYLNNNRTEPISGKDMNTIFGYISTLAFKMFQTKESIITIAKLHGFENDYRKDIDFEPNYSMQNELITSGILVEYEDGYKFSHKYIYYYFVGYYFSQNLDDTDTTKIIEGMIQRLYRTEFSNILMFILHLSPKTSIIKLLIKEAKAIFEDIEEFSFANEEIVNINNLIKNDTAHSLQDRTMKESRDIELSKQDNFKRIEEEHPSEELLDADYDEEIQVLDFFQKLNLAFKMLEILGEIVKSYSGTLKKDIKYDLITNTYGIGLRSLKVVIVLFEEHHESLVEDLTNTFAKKGKLSNDSISEDVAGFVFSMISSISTDTVKKISKAIGSRDLKSTYKRISDSDSDNLAYQLIQHAIDLSFPKGLNQSKIENLNKALVLDKNTLTSSSLKKLVLEHLYMYKVSTDVKTSICANLDIDMKASKNKMIQQNR